MTHPILSHPSAPLGSVQHLTFYEPELFKPPCIVLCRVTAPLVSFAYDLLRRHVPCTVKGKDIGAGLVALVKKLRAVDIGDVYTKLNAWHVNEISRAEGAGKSPERIEDQYQCLRVFLSDMELDNHVQVLVMKIEKMFSEDTDSSRVLLSTIHRAKGLEYPNVFILDRSRTLPSKYALTREAKEQEKNLWYVAVTRAKENLYYINSNCWSNAASS
jgi:hypothetical protein